MSVIGVPDFPIALPAPRAPRFGLLQSAPVLTQNEHWLGGVEVRRWYEDNLQAWSGLTDASGPTTVQEKSDPARELDTLKSAPFTIEGAYTCGRGYIESEALFQDRASTVFAAFEGKAVEAALWDGPPAPVDMPYLDDGNVDVLNGGAAVKPGVGLALLEQAIADSDAPTGVIHMRPGLASMFGSTILTVGANTMTTAVGTPVVSGVGYPGTHGGANAALAEWAIATGPVVVVRGAVQVLPMLDRDTNDWVVRVERDYLVVFDSQVQAAVKIDKAL